MDRGAGTVRVRLKLTGSSGVSAIDVNFQDMTPTEGRVGRIQVTPDMLNVEWNATALYPAGYFSRQINFAVSLKLPSTKLRCPSLIW